MGVAACAQVTPLGECRPACCSDGTTAGPDAASEYQPGSCAGLQQECVEPALPTAVSSTAGVRRASASAPPRGLAADSGAANVGRSISHSYFARELPEFAELSAGGVDGQRPPFTFRTHAVYSGQWRGKFRHGFGIQTWPDGASFAGRWEDNKANGPGRFVHADSDVFVGQWRANAASGCGVYYHKGGLITYRGQWVHDLQQGHGIEECDGGARYVGQFNAGMKQGYGTYYWPDSSQYEGQWWANSINGYGLYQGNDGRRFRGMWRDAVIHGFGQYEWPDGRRFCGQYKDDQKDGFGIFKWKDGRRFEGFWTQGKQNGCGATYLITGEMMRQGVWDMGVFREVLLTVSDLPIIHLGAVAPPPELAAATALPDFGEPL